MNSEDELSSIQWLLMIHQLPAKPAYLRVKIGRKLQSLGAVPIKNAVHALPLHAVTAAGYKELLSEIIASDGEGLICEAQFIGGLTDVEVRTLFDAARNADYDELVEAGRELLESDEITVAEVRRFRRRLDEIARIDFFSAHGRQAADSMLVALDRGLRRHPDVSRTDEPPRLARSDLKNRIWVTRRDIHIDRIASAWLIRRFIDKAAIFRFVDVATYAPQSTDLRFDMANAEFTHEGDDCTFETLLQRTNIANPALRAIADIIHDLDIEDGKFGRPETVGLGALIVGACATATSDDERLELGSGGLDQFYAYFSKG